MNHVTLVGTAAYRPVPVRRQGRDGVMFATCDVFGPGADSERPSAATLTVVCWDALADAAANLAPGDLVAVAGKLVPYHYLGKLALCRSLEVHATELRILTHRLFLFTREGREPDNPPQGDPHVK